MIYLEEDRDLFSVPDQYALINITSADFTPDGNISSGFENIHKTSSRLISLYGDYISIWDRNVLSMGTCIRTEKILSLIIKREYNDKATYRTIRNALSDLKYLLITSKIKKIAIPGDIPWDEGLSWRKISRIIMDIFIKTDIEILVCHTAGHKTDIYL